MKVAILGSAPSSLGLAPFGDPSWVIWGCSPGVYYQCPRVNAWWELHRWEPPVIGNPGQQKQWFSPEYVAWMALRQPGACPVWMQAPVPEIPASRGLPIEDLKERYGTFFLTSSIAIMIACAIDDILAERRAREVAGEPPLQDAIGLYGVDMAANEEYGYQRAGCQHFLLMAADLGIHVEVPPESDLLRPMPVYGFCEGTHWHIKNLVRQRELQQRKAHAEAQMQQARDSLHFLNGALDDLNYQMLTWGEDRTAMGVDPSIQALFPKVREDVLASIKPSIPTAGQFAAAGAKLDELPVPQKRAPSKKRKR